MYFSPYRLRSAQSSKVSLAESTGTPIPRISSESNLQLLRTEEQAKLTSSLSQTRSNFGSKFAAKNQSTTSIASDVTATATSFTQKHIPTPIAINVSNSSPSSSVTNATPLWERHLSLVGKLIINYKDID